MLLSYRRRPSSSLFPYTTLFRSDALGDETDYDVVEGLGGPLAVVDEQIVAPESVEQAHFRGWIARRFGPAFARRSEEHTSELQSHSDLVCRLLLEKKKKYY